MDADKDQKQALAVAFQTKRASSAKKKKPEMAYGGSVGGGHPPQGETNAEGGMVGRIMRKHQDRMMADGGQVEVDNMEPGNNLDEYNEDAILKELYEEDSRPQPEDSNEHGDSAEAPGGSLADRIRAKIRNKI